MSVLPLRRVLSYRKPTRGNVLLAFGALAAYFLFGTAMYDPTLWETGGAGSTAMTVWTVAWVAVFLIGAWSLGAILGAAFAVAISLLTVPIALLASGRMPPMDLNAWVVTLFISVVFGVITGALADAYRQARLRTQELARKNEELQKASEALARSDAMFREFADRIELGMWIAPQEDVTKPYVNAAASRMFEMERAGEWLELVHPDDRKLALESVERLRRGEPQDVEYRLKAPGAHPRWVRAQSFAVLGPEGKPISFAGIVEDVTERKEREAKRELIERRERLSALGTLVAGVAHEVNNPLTYVMGNMELARVEYADIAKRHGILPEESQRLERLMSTSFQGSERIARIVRALRAVTRGGEGDAVEEVNLNAIASNVHALMRTSVPGAITIDLALCAEDPIVRGNSGELHQLLLNLATNAVQAMGTRTGRITIGTGVDAESASLSVRDEGPGIAPDVRARLFTPFFTTKPEGTGLGLSIAHAIVREHNGEVDVESRSGEGALFRVRMPRVDRPAMREVPA